MKQGTVRTWIADRGFGFIRPDGERDDVFAHVSNCVGKRNLKVDDRVQFDTAENERNGRMQAVNVAKA